MNPGRSINPLFTKSSKSLISLECSKPSIIFSNHNDSSILKLTPDKCSTPMDLSGQSWLEFKYIPDSVFNLEAHESLIEILSDSSKSSQTF